MSALENGTPGSADGSVYSRPIPSIRPSSSSKSRFAEYVRRYRQRAEEDGKYGEPMPGTPEAERAKRRRSRSFFALFRAFWGLQRGRRRFVAVSLATVTMATVFGLVQPYATKIAIDNIMLESPGPEGLPEWARAAFGEDRLTLLFLLGGFLLTVAVVSQTVALYGRAVLTRTVKITQAAVRRRAFQHVERLPLHRVYQLKSGGAASILREDAQGVGDLFFSLLYNPWKAVVQLAGALLVLAWTDWRFLLGGVALLPVVWITHRTWIARIRPVFSAIKRNREATDGHAVEAFGGMRVVRGFARQKGEAARFMRNNHLMARQEMLAWWWSRIAEMVWILMIPAASVFILLYGGSRVIKGELTVGEVMMFTTYLLWLLGPLETLVGTATGVQQNLAGLDRILDLLAEPAELTPAAAAGEKAADGEARRSGWTPSGNPARTLLPAAVVGRISIENVSFAYPGREEHVLKGITLQAEPGSTVALVGPSGGGKTTLCNLVARFFDPTEGVITLDGTDLREIDVQSYRRLLGIVEQDVFLFDGPVIDNIAYARRGVTFEQVRAAARSANAETFIQALERGYETVIGERGVRLSGGQKQRIAIARALLADPKILILDEATSNLDSESEALIQRSLRGLMKGRTCFVIAHRLSTIRHADLIAVIEDGRLVEQGTHDTLAAKDGGRYRAMLDMQQAARREHEDEWVVPGEVRTGNPT